MGLLEVLGLKKPRRVPSVDAGRGASPPGIDLKAQLADALKQLAPIPDSATKARLGNRLAEIGRQAGAGGDATAVAQAAVAIQAVLAEGQAAIAAAAQERERALARKTIAAFAKTYDTAMAKAAPEIDAQPIAGLKKTLVDEADALRARRAEIDGLEPTEGAQRMKALDSAASELARRAASLRGEAQGAVADFRRMGEQPVAATGRALAAAVAEARGVYQPWYDRVRGALAAARRTLEAGRFDPLLAELGGIRNACLGLDRALASYAVEKPKYDKLRDSVVAMIARLRDSGLLDADGAKAVAGLEARVGAADVVGTRMGYGSAQNALNQVIVDAKKLRDSNAAYRDFNAERDRLAKRLAELRKHPQAGNLAAEFKRIDQHLDAAGDLARLADGGALKALTALKAIAAECESAAALAKKLAAAAAKLPLLTKKLEAGGVPQAKVAETARFAIKVLVEENCSDDDAVKMARDASGYRDEGLDEQDAIVSSRVKKSLTDSGLSEGHARSIGRSVRAAGTATADDAKALAQAMKGVSQKAIDTLNEAGIVSECCRGPITDALPDLAGVQPRGWPDTATWDEVPGVYDPNVKKLVVGTMETADGKRKVPATGEGPLPHGAADLFGHEAGHAFDAADGGGKSGLTAFLVARKADVLAKAMVGSRDGGDDDYFMTEREGGGNTSGADSETFAESFAMHFAKSARWPKLEDFWKSNPWGI